MKPIDKETLLDFLAVFMPVLFIGAMVGAVICSLL